MLGFPFRSPRLKLLQDEGGPDRRRSMVNDTIHDANCRNQALALVDVWQGGF